MIDDFLKKYGLTRYTVSQVSGVSQSLLSDANKRDVNALTVKILTALAMATGKTSGEVLDELMAQQGNPVIAFIAAHPGLNKKMVSEVEDLMIDLHELDANLKNVTFNRYYDEGEDTNERATIALENLKLQLTEMKAVIADDKNKDA